MSRPGPLHRQLIEQARHLANRGSPGTQQADLRRAASATYYALFHFLIDEACRFLLGPARGDRATRAILARAFVHGEMAQASSSFAGGTLPAKMEKILSGVPKPLSKIAAAFVDLQGFRHKADYDVSATFMPDDVNALIDRAEAATADWAAIRRDPATRLFLLSLLVFERIKKIKE